MAEVDVLILGGTWSSDGDPVTEAFSTALDPIWFRPRMVAYPADYGRQISYAASRTAGMNALAREVAASPNRVVIVGYSQGAGIAGDFAAEVGTGFYPGLRAKVAACGLIADPLRPHRTALGADPGGYGILGQRSIPHIPTYWVAAERDPITSLPAGSPLRSVADLTEYWCLASPGAFLKWGQSVVDRANRPAGWQRWWHSTGRKHVVDTVDWTRGYLVDGRHTTAYVAEGHCAALAEAVAREVNIPVFSA
ncbi:MAG: cutinase family protein [Mycobacteriaceae bacterium]|nr:cutinase family protein [Mycobacteriaceae bacterium]